MKTAIVKWGNSNAVRLPKPLTDVLDLHENDAVQISVEDGAIVIRKPYPSSFRALIDGYKGDYTFEEWDTGAPVGDEVW
jgi:antitoxin MazE